MRTGRGFTLIELLVVITIIGILAAIALPNYIRAKDKAKEVQGKAHLHSLQVALERYQTDFEKYPTHLLGGDQEGWRHWHDLYDEPNPPLDDPANAWVQDPLIQYSYFESYPTNPFVDNGQVIIQQTGPVTAPAGGYEPGMGDPRFGYRGNTIGMGLDAPMVFENWPAEFSSGGNFHEPVNIETRRTLDTVTNNQSTAKGFANPVKNGEDPDEPMATGFHYMMGGRRVKVNINGQDELTPVYTFWPGNFFYRGFPERFTLRKGWTIEEPNFADRAEISRYMLGYYGAFTSEGVDCIRLEYHAADSIEPMRYRMPSPFDNYDFQLSWYPIWWQKGGMPEVAGGGDAERGPWLPYDKSEEFRGSFIYGSPDGIPDGIILILTSGDEVQAW